MDQRPIIQIATVSNIYFDQRMIRIASSLQDFGYEINVFYRPYIKFGNQTAKEVGFNFKTTPINILPQRGVLFYLIYNFAILLKLFKVKTDFYYAVDSDTLLALTILSKLKNKPLIYDAHEYFAEVPELNGKLFKKKIWHYITQYGVNQSSLCITVSESLANSLKKKYKKSFKVLRNLPHRNDIHNIEKEDIPTVIYQGALNKGRGLELLIKAMTELKYMQCWIIGEGDLSETLRSLKNELNAKNVKFWGVLSPDELKLLTPKCFVGFNLLDDESLSYHDSLSNKYFDYMHAGIPSISSFLPEYVSLNNAFNCGICIDNNENKFIETIESWIKYPEKYTYFQNNAIIACQTLCWENESQNIGKWLKNIQ